MSSAYAKYAAMLGIDDTEEEEETPYERAMRMLKERQSDTINVKPSDLRNEQPGPVEKPRDFDISINPFNPIRVNSEIGPAAPTPAEIADLPFWTTVMGNVADMAPLAKKIMHIQPGTWVHEKMYGPVEDNPVYQAADMISTELSEQKEKAKQKYLYEHPTSGAATLFTANELVDLWDLVPSGLLLKYGTKGITKAIASLGGPAEKFAKRLDMEIIAKIEKQAARGVSEEKVFKDLLTEKFVTPRRVQSDLEVYKLQKEIEELETELGTLSHTRGPEGETPLFKAVERGDSGKFVGVDKPGYMPTAPEEHKLALGSRMEEAVRELVDKRKALEALKKEQGDSLDEVVKVFESGPGLDKEGKMIKGKWFDKNPVQPVNPMEEAAKRFVEQYRPKSTARGSIEQYGEDYVDSVLESAGKGMPGLESSDLGVIYRDSNGDPVFAALTYGTDTLKDVARKGWAKPWNELSKEEQLLNSSIREKLYAEIERRRLSLPEPQHMSAEAEKAVARYRAKNPKVSKRQISQFVDLAKALDTRVDNVLQVGRKPTLVLEDLYKKNKELGELALAARNGDSKALEDIDRVAKELYELKRSVIAPHTSLEKEALKLEPLKQETIGYLADLHAVEANPGALLKQIEVQHNPKLRDYAFDFFINNLLSSTGTHTRNLLGNMAHVLVTSASIRIQPTLSKIFPNMGKYTSKNAAAALEGMRMGTALGLREAVEVMKRGLDPSDTAMKFANRNAFANSPNKLLQKVAPYLTIPTRALNAMDSIFYSIGKHGKMWELASKEAEHLAAVHSTEYADELVQLIAHPTDEMLVAGAKHGNFLKFTDEISPFSQAVVQFRNTPFVGVPFRFVNPFVRISDRLIARGMEMTPYSFWVAARHGEKVAGRELDLMARGIMGTGVAAAIGTYVFNPFREDMDKDTLPTIVGSMPENKVIRDFWYKQGVQPHSIRIGNKYIPFNQIEPFGTVFSLITAAQKTQQDHGDSPAAYKMAFYAGNIIGATLDKSTLQNIQDLLQLGEKPELSAEGINKVLLNVMGGFMPAAGLMRQVSRIIDPYLREKRTAEDTLVSLEELLKGQGLIEGAFAQTLSIGNKTPDIAGNPIDLLANKPMGSLAAGGTPVNTSVIKQDPVYQEMEKVWRSLPEDKREGVLPSYVSNKMKIEGLGTVELSPEERAIYLALSNQPLFKEVERQMKTPGWKKMSLGQRADRIKAIKSAKHSAARMLMESWMRTVESTRLTDEQKEKRLKGIGRGMTRLLGLGSLTDLPFVEKDPTTLN